MPDIKQLLKQLRDDYLNELPEKIQLIEALVLNLNKDKDRDNFNELYRHIHNQKGTSGTHGLPFLSTICHQFENELADINENLDLITEAHIKNWFSYLDLFSEVADHLKQGNTDTSKFENRLKTFRNTINKTTYSCLLVDTKSATLNIINEVLKQHSIHTVIIEDAYDALGRLLIDKFDMLICGMKASSLSGIGVISALKTSSSINHNIPSILITSTLFERTLRDNDPDYIIKKDTNLPVLLDEVCNKIKKTLNN
jgi:CheY-like chemotaxis protein